MTSDADRLVNEYLASLDRELRDLPRARRRELIEEIADHIAEARADLDSDDEAEVRNLLERLGDPADIAEASRDRLGVRRRQSGIVDVLALVALLVGGLVVPVAGWFVGLVLLWVSEAWTTREKLLGTFVVPGGLAPAVYLLTLGLYGRACSGVLPNEDGLGDWCGEASGLLSPAWLVAIALLLVAPLATAAFLALRLRRSAPAGYQPSAGSA